MGKGAIVFAVAFQVIASTVLGQQASQDFEAAAKYGRQLRLISAHKVD